MNFLVFNIKAETINMAFFTKLSMSGTPSKITLVFQLRQGCNTLKLPKIITVNHKILLSKLKGYNVKGSILNLLQNCLYNRIHSILINNVVSEHEIVNVVIPQNSCLGPLLFLVYINDIFSSTEINMRLFVDDACLSYQHILLY